MEHDVCQFAELADGAVLRAQVAGVVLAVVRLGEDVFAVADTCSHANYSLSDGEVLADTCELDCPKHGSAFSLVTGEPASLPATDPVAVYPARVDDGMVKVEVGS